MPRKTKNDWKGYDSQEELIFSYWLDEAKEHGFVNSWEYHPRKIEIMPPAYRFETVKMKTKTKKVRKTLLRAWHCEPDFYIATTPKWDTLDHGLLYSNPNCESADGGYDVIVDTKGEYEKESSKKQVFSRNQKGLWYTKNCFMNKLIIPTSTNVTNKLNFFERTWVPAEVAYCLGRKTRTRKKIYSRCRLIEELFHLLVY